ncbi:MAG: hypothetical protein HDS77_05815 [Bacteroidales bacterium]|nr:hypothetical protein [Bacteroidales bacterium]
MTEELNQYEVISVAYRSRLFFRTEAEYRRALGVSFETVVNKRDSERDMNLYYSILSGAAEGELDRTLYSFVMDYVRASEFYQSLDWGERTQMASRKRFCRMLFRIYATCGMRLTDEEKTKFKMRNDDYRLLDAFFPEGPAGEPEVEPCFIMLFVFGVLRPWGGDTTRGRDIRDEETIASLERLRDLIALLKDDMVRIGSTDKPLAFDQWLTIITSVLDGESKLSEVSPITLVSSLTDISRACRTILDATRQREHFNNLTSIYMPGIWIDDADKGVTRFWIFPDNCLMAFCYRRNGIAWELLPYEFFMQSGSNAGYDDNFMLSDPIGNLRLYLSSDKTLSYDDVGVGIIEVQGDEEAARLTQITLSENVTSFPTWLNWQSWQRLDPDSEQYREFLAVLRNLYDPESPHSLLFKNLAPEISDISNCIVGRDRRYIYLYDFRPKRYCLTEPEPEHFYYDSDECAAIDNVSIFDLEPSEEHPLYAIPIAVERKSYNNLELDRFVGMLADDAANVNKAYIVHSPRSRCPRLLFPNYSILVWLDMDILQPLGVRKFTSRPV